jgi:dihydrolipoamide dehydrogenase
MKNFDLVIIGAGPGGYVAAIRGAQLGMKTALVEKQKMGGCCLNWGCIPARRLMESAKLYDRIRNASAGFGIEGIDPKALHFNWKKALSEKDRIVAKLVKGVEFLMRKNGVEVITGTASLDGPTNVRVGDGVLIAKNIIIATGSRPDRSFASSLPSGLAMEIDDFYALAEIPERFVINGGDTVACEMANMLHLIGKQVTIVTSHDKLMPWLDEACTSFVRERFKKQGIKVLFETQITGARKGGVLVGNELVECDLVLNCTERTAVLPEMSDVRLDKKDGFLKTNEFMQTNVPNIYAIGDVTGTIFAHFASAQGSTATNHMAGINDPLDYDKLPVNIYLDPEIAAVGLTEEQVKSRSIEYVKGEFPMSVNSKAMVEGQTDGFVKILADQQYGEILGVHIVSARATDLIAEAVMSMSLEDTLESMTKTVHAHPTISETFMEAGFKAIGKPLHV